MPSAGATRATSKDIHSAWRFGFFPQLDGFRGVSIVLVLIGHALFFQMGQLAALGVMMFFVLGGFLITGLLSKEFLASGTIGLKQFYLRRALRIFLAFFLLIAGMSLLIKAGYVTDVP